MRNETGISRDLARYYGMEIWEPKVIIPSTALSPSMTTEQRSLALVLDSLCYPPNLMTDSYWDSEVGHSLLWWRHYVVGEFCRQLLDSKFSLFRVPKRNPQLKETVKATAILWLKTWECLERLNSLGFLKISPSEALAKLVKDNAFVMPFFFEVDLKAPITGEYLKRFSQKGTRPGGNPYIKAIQLENQRLLTLEGNPFPDSFTQLFIEVCQAVANQSDQFRNTRYTPMIRARTQLVTVLRSHKAQTFGAVREKRGRHSKNIRQQQPN